MLSISTHAYGFCACVQYSMIQALIFGCELCKKIFKYDGGLNTHRYLAHGVCSGHGNFGEYWFVRGEASIAKAEGGRMKGRRREGIER